MLSYLTLTLLLQATPLDDNLAFQEGKRLSEQFEYEKAIFRFREAARDESLGVERATALVWLGLTYAKIGEQGAADEAFLQAVRLDPLVALPPSTPPKILEALEGARRRLRDSSVLEKPATPPQATTTRTVDPAAACQHGFREGDQCVDAGHDATPATTSPATTSPATKVTEDEGAGGGLVLGGGTLLGVGAVVVGGAVYFGLTASQTSTSAAGAVFQDERAQLNDDAASQALVANVLYGVGAAVAVGGLATLGVGLAGGGQ
jgi:hypothetical protein